MHYKNIIACFHKTAPDLSTPLQSRVTRSTTKLMSRLTHEQAEAKSPEAKREGRVNKYMTESSPSHHEAERLFNIPF